MTQITRKGKELSDLLNPMIGTTREIRETCSLICRHAVTHHRYQEDDCNGPGQWVARLSAERASKVYERFYAELERKEERLERRITELVESLPHTDEGPLAVALTGDPRGCTVTILLPVELRGYANNWGRDGICVPSR